MHVNRENKRGRGVAICISKSTDFVEIKSMSSVVNNIMECVAAELTLNKVKNAIIGCIYTTPDIFNDTYELLLHQVKHQKNNIFCGDYNLDLLKHDTHTGKQIVWISCTASSINYQTKSNLLC